MKNLRIFAVVCVFMMVASGRVFGMDTYKEYRRGHSNNNNSNREMQQNPSAPQRQRPVPVVNHAPSGIGEITVGAIVGGYHQAIGERAGKVFGAGLDTIFEGVIKQGKWIMSDPKESCRIVQELQEHNRGFINASKQATLFLKDATNKCTSETVKEDLKKQLTTIQRGITSFDTYKNVTERLVYKRHERLTILQTQLNALLELQEVKTQNHSPEDKDEFQKMYEAQLKEFANTLEECSSQELRDEVRWEENKATIKKAGVGTVVVGGVAVGAGYVALDTLGNWITKGIVGG